MKSLRIGSAHCLLSVIPTYGRRLGYKRMAVKCVLLTAMFVWSAVQAASVFSLTTDYSKPTETYHSGSVAGGTMLFVDGTNLMTHDPFQLEILVGEQTCVFDHFLMKESYIECTVPPKEVSNPSFNATIAVKFQGKPVPVNPAANPVFYYTTEKTGVVYGLSPSQQSPMSPLSFYGAWKTEGDSSLYMEIRAANKHMEFLPEFSTYQASGTTFIATNLGDNVAGDMDPTVRLAASYGFAQFHWTAKQYTLSGDPYLFKTLAEVKALEFHSGSRAGGLEVTVQGVGFPSDPTHITADIEGNSCHVTSSSYTSLTCTTSAQLLTESGPKYEGYAGLRHYRWYNLTKTDTLLESEADIADIVPMADSFPPHNDLVELVFVEKWVGYFKPPRTGEYVFYVSSDDGCEVWLSTDMTEGNKVRVINYSGYTGFRDMLSRTSTRSAAISLVSGQSYYLEIWHSQWSGDTHFSIGVEVPSPGHATANNMPSVQQLTITPAQLTREVQRVTLSGVPTGGSIVFTYKGKSSSTVNWPSTGSLWTCGDILAAMKNLAISSLSCAVVTTPSIAYDFTFTYAWTDIRGLIGASLSNAQPAGMSAATTQTVRASKPLTGTYKLTWNSVVTDDIPLQTSANKLQSQLNTNFTDFSGNLMVSGYANADGVHLQFIFGDSLNPTGTVPLIAATANVVTAADEGPAVVTVTESIPGSTNQFWWAIPSEFFRTIEDYPVLRVYTDGQPALCRGNCAFQYSVNSPTVNSVTYAASVTMTGVNFPAACDLISVSIGGTNCPVTSCSTTSIVCSQGVGMVGTYTPVVHIAGSGLAVLASGLATVSYSLAITSVSPAVGSIGGGTLLTIIGSGFLPDMHYPGSTQSITIGNSECVVQTTSGSTITCITSPQTTTSLLTLTVGSSPVTSTGFTYDPSSSPTITSINPTYASTIVKTTLTITGTNFSTIGAGSVTVFVGAVECYVTASTATTVTCNLLGGPTGSWLMVVSIPGRGNAVHENYPLVFRINSVTPATGSINGGTLLTLTGNGFSTRATQLLVMFGDQSHMCVLEGTPTEQLVKCRTPVMGSLVIETNQEVVLLGRLQEEAVCASTCTFKYSAAATPVISGLDVTTGPAGTTVVISGTGFGTNSSTTTVLFGSKPASVSSVSATQVTVIVPNQEANDYSISLTFDEIGTASGDFTFSQTVEVTNVTPTTGSQTGTDVTITGTGFASQAVVTFGSVACQVSSATAAEIRCRLTGSSLTTVQLLTITQVKTYTCTNNSLCGFTFSAGLTPSISSATVSGTTVTVTGSGLSTTMSDIRMTVGKVACTVSASSLTSISATCNPPSGSQKVEVFVTGKGYASGNVSISTTFNASGATGQGSFGGGTQIALTGSGLGPGTTVKVCGFPCSPVTATYSSLTCPSPPLPSDFSQSQFNLIPSDTIITTGFTASTAASNYPLSSIFDGNFTTYYSSTASPCYLQLDSGVNHKTLLSSFHLYPAEDSLNTYRSFVGTNLTYSDDGVTWSVAYTYTVMYAGWNYYNVPVNQDADDDYPVFKARYFRLEPPSASKCKLAEIEVRGVVTQIDSSNSLTCNVEVFDSGVTTPVAGGTFQYMQTMTPTVTAVSPTTGTILGGTVLTFTGTLLSGVTAVTIDTVPCVIGTATATSFTCTTGPRQTLTPSSISITTTSGYAVLMDVTFLYADRWSSPTTWGGEVPPKEGESVQIPVGMTILLDVPTPELMLLLIEGTLIVEDVPGITLDANYIFINSGSFQIGTPTHHFQNEFTLTLHGRRASPMMPIYGNKVLAVYCGLLDMHGIPRSVTWTSLENTVMPGDTTLTVQVVTDWKVGESIVVASTSYEHTEAEQRTIVAITGGKVITVDTAFQYKHYAATETYGTKTIEMRAEVGLLTRNIKITGSKEGTDEQHGAHVMAYAPGDDRVVARISYVEIFNAGQAFSVGAYPFHFHMIGAVRNSYIIGTAVHHTYNRAFTIHNIQYLRIINNVAYHTMGHTIFVEDGAETKNRIENNLVVSVSRSWSRLNTDTTPAGIWVTNPDNYVIGNHVAGSDAYGIWYDLHPNPTGPSATTLICPFGTPLGEFRDNVAHSAEKYGFRLFHGHVPLTYPCKPALNTTADDPWADNPPVTAYYRNFLGYKCKRNGAIADRIGDVRWVNFTVADNILAGIEMTYTLDTPHFTIPFLSDALIIGKSGNTEPGVDLTDSIGFIAPQSDGFLGQNIAFFNFDNTMYALGDESHSQNCHSRDFGGRHNQLQGLSFTNSVKRIHWEYPRRSFFEILDDSLTGNAGAYIAAFWPHLIWEPYCVYDDLYNGIVCDGSKEMRRVHMLNLEPSTTFFLMQITVRRAAGDNIPLATPVSSGRFLTDTTEPDYWWSSMEPVGGTQYHNVPKAWAVPMILGTEYLVHWGTTPMDWTYMTLRIDTFDDPSRWVMVRYNFTDHREMFHVNRGVIPSGTNTKAVGYVDPTLLPISTTLAPTDLAGTSNFDNVTSMEFKVMITGKEVPRSNSGDLTVTAYRCFGTHCVISNTTENVTMETFQRVWSNPESWPSGFVPIDGERVTILPEWTMILDTNTAVLSFLEVNGILQFDNTTSVTLNADMIHVRRGKILSGAQDYPLLPNITHQIVISGTFTSTAYAFDPNIEVVNKAFIVTGEMQLYGAKRKSWVHLVQNAHPGDGVIFVERVNWQPGDQLVLTSSSFYQNETEVVTIATVTAGIDLMTGVDSGISLESDSEWIKKSSTRSNGRFNTPVFNDKYESPDAKSVTKLTLTTSLQYYHSGSILVVEGQAVDMRAEVGVLTSNVVIRGTENGWACNFVVADFVDYNVVDSNPVRRTGTVTLDSIAIDYCGQNSTLRTGLRFESTTLPSTVSNSIIKRSQTYSVNIQNSANIRLLSNTFFYAVRFGVFIQTSKNLLLDNNLMVNVTQRPTVSLPFDKPTGYVVCPSERGSCANVVLTRNVAAGYALLGFADGGYSCGSSPTFANNVAHSGVSGWITSNIPGNCVEMTGFTAYMNSETAVVTALDTPSLTLSNLRLADNFNGIGGNLGGEATTGNIVTVSDSIIVGKTIHSHCNPAECFTPQCGNRRGILLGTYQNMAKQWSINGKLKLPIYNVSQEEVFHAEFYYKNIVFANFNSTDECKANNTAIAGNELCPDYTPLSVFSGIKLVNVANDSIFYMPDPDPEWQNKIFCGEFPCTGLKNAIVRDTDGSLVGNSYGGYLLPNNPGITDLNTCQFLPRSNGYLCRKSPVNDYDYAVMVFENMDSDARNVTVSPVYVTSEDTVLNVNAEHFYNKLNSFMSMIWDGFYLGTNRLPRFPTAIGLNRKYNMTFTGIPPDNMRFQLQGAVKSSDGVMLTVNYRHPYTVTVYVNDTRVYPLTYGKYVNLSSSSGTNQWLNKDSQLQFMLRPYDMITLQRVDSIQVSVRMNMTTADFFSSNGPTEFVDRLAAILGIPPYRIRVVDVRSGSTIVDFAMTGNEALASKKASNSNYTNALQEELVTLNTLLMTMAQNGSLVLNAPILSVESTVNFTNNATTANTVPTTITPTPNTDGNGVIVPESSSSDDEFLPWWGYLLVAVGGLLIICLFAGCILLLYLCHKRISKPKDEVIVNVSQSAIGFQKVEPEKPLEVQDLEEAQGVPTTQLYPNTQVKEKNQPRAARW